MHEWWDSHQAKGCAHSSWDETGIPDYPTGHPGWALSSPKLPLHGPSKGLGSPSSPPWIGLWGPPVGQACA